MILTLSHCKVDSGEKTTTKPPLYTSVPGGIHLQIQIATSVPIHKLGVLVLIIVTEDLLYKENRVERVWDMAVWSRHHVWWAEYIFRPNWGCWQCVSTVEAATAGTCTEPYNKLCYAKERMTVLTTNCPAGWIACFNFTCSQNINQNAQWLEPVEGICKKACLICPGKMDYCLTQENSWTNSVPSSACCWKHSPVNIQQKVYLLHFCCLLQQSWRQLCQTWLLCHRDGISHKLVLTPQDLRLTEGL